MLWLGRHGSPTSGDSLPSPSAPKQVHLAFEIHPIMPVPQPESIFITSLLMGKHQVSQTTMMYNSVPVSYQALSRQTPLDIVVVFPQVL